MSKLRPDRVAHPANSPHVNLLVRLTGRIQALEKDIRDWIGHWNDNPQPFVWTKTADEILDRLNSYLQRIPGA